MQTHFHVHADQELYKTVWEIKQKTIIDMAADRGPFICQSQVRPPSCHPALIPHIEVAQE